MKELEKRLLAAREAYSLSTDEEEKELIMEEIIELENELIHNIVYIS